MVIPTITIMTGMITGIRISAIITNAITGNDINSIMAAIIKSTARHVVITIAITIIIATHNHAMNMHPIITITPPATIYKAFLKFRDHLDTRHGKILQRSIWLKLG